MPQSLHPDFETNAPDTEYFFLGTGKILAAIQWSKNPVLTPLGILVSDPARFARKWSTHLFHPEHGLGKTSITVIIDGIRYRPAHETTTVHWDFENGVPTVLARWKAGSANVEERFWCSNSSSSIVRGVEISGAVGLNVQIEVALYANPALHDWFSAEDGRLFASGYAKTTIYSSEPAVPKERIMTIAGNRVELRYDIGSESQAPSKSDEGDYWHATSKIAAKDPKLEPVAKLFQTAAMGLRAAVSEDGRFDASIWQYGFEWSGDAAHVAEALMYSGQFERARAVLNNILTRLSNDEGMVMESSRFRGGADAELNNNGAVLKACHTYYEWTGDLEFLRSNKTRISAIADCLLLTEHFDESVGLLIGARDLWERTAELGILPGYDVAHQTFGIVGLEAASKIAKAIGADGSRWKIAADRIRESFLSHPTHSMIDNGRVIKRRLKDGTIQRQLQVHRTEKNAEFLSQFMPEGTPLASAMDAGWEPDATEALAIVHGIVDPKSEVAKNTINEMVKLWAPGGGYYRYNVASEPDSPGAWPFATEFVAAACLEMRDNEKAMRAIEWLIAKVGAAGSWFEFYGDRPTPPLPPTGIIVWGWAEWITLVIRHLLNARVEDGKLQINPRIEGLAASIRFRDSYVTK